MIGVKIQSLNTNEDYVTSPGPTNYHKSKLIS